jgi:hypothetical protein
MIAALTPENILLPLLAMGAIEMQLFRWSFPGAAFPVAVTGLLRTSRGHDFNTLSCPDQHFANPYLTLRKYLRVIY